MSKQQQPATIENTTINTNTQYYSSLVSFGPKQRFLGEAAKTQEVSNFKNTVGNLKRLVGRTVADPEIQEVEQKNTPIKFVDVDGQVGVQVREERHTSGWSMLSQGSLGQLPW